MTTDLRLTGARMRERYGVSDMTLWRWLHDARLAFPRPMMVNGRRYWSLAEIEAWERLQAAKPKAA